MWAADSFLEIVLGCVPNSCAAVLIVQRRDRFLPLGAEEAFFNGITCQSTTYSHVLKMTKHQKP